MSGIIGQISFDKQTDKHFIKKGLRLIGHRGEDDSGYMMTDYVGIGHNLLSITGDKTRQPVSNQERTIFAAVNGEFYDYEDIIKEFNMNVQTNSDSEMIIQLYQRGLLFKYLESGKLNGEFSFFLYDSIKNKVYLGRDSFGIKPLYIYRHNENVYVSSEIKGFLALHSLAFDPNSLYSVLSMQYHDTYNTLFDEVKQVQPGTVLLIDVNKRTFSEITYFNMSFEENTNTFEENKIILLSTLRNSVRRRIENTKKTGIALSGGIDSASVLALASECRPNLNAYTISFKNGDDYDELKAAEEMALRYSANFTPIVVDENTLLQNLEQSLYHSENVSMNMHVASKYLLFKKMADDGCKVSLSGEGADEILFGYPHFKMDMGYDLSSENNKYVGLDSLSEILNTAKIEKELGFVPTFLKTKYALGFKMHTHTLRDDYLAHYVNHDPASYIIRLYELSKKNKPVFNSSILWSKIGMSNYVLNALCDKVEMAHTIEGRIPFLDREFYNFARTIPLDQKIHMGQEKYILKEAMKPFITDTIYNQEKQPFISPPLFNWQNSKFVYEHLMDVVHSSTILNSHCFDQAKILNMIDLIKRGKLEAGSYDQVIMMIFSLYYLDKNFCRNP